MDLSKLSFPVFVLEPRSFLDKMSDTFRHAHFFTEAALAEVRRPLAVHLYSIFVWLALHKSIPASLLAPAPNPGL